MQEAAVAAPAVPDAALPEAPVAAPAVALQEATATATATAAAPAAAVPDGAAAPPAPQPKLICHMEKPTGSNIGRRICRTKAVLEEDEKQAHDVMDRVHSARNVSDPAG